MTAARARPRAPAAAAALFAAAALLPLGGCNSSLGDLVGAATGTAAAAGSGNPAVGVAIGVGARAVADYGVRTISRRWRRTEQDALAEAVGGMEVGEARRWEVRHDLPIGNERGEVRVVRAVDTPLAQCREALFSVDRGEGPDARRRWFLASACRQEQGWKWAAAEPATERWTSLQ